MSDFFKVSSRVARMKGSFTLEAARRAAEIRQSGKEIIDLTVGEPDFDTPEFIKEFAVSELKKGRTKYTPSSGASRFTEAVSGFLNEQFHSEITPAEVSATCGGKQALFNAVCTLIEPGDDVLVPAPYWVTFPEIIVFAGGNPIFIDTETSDFVLTAEAVSAAITPRTRLLIVNSPNNPTGKVIPPAEIRRIVEVCAEKNVFVLTDECYLFFVYPPAGIYSSVALPEELRKYVCIAGSFSKTFAMTGWRIGFTIANPEWSKAMVKLQSHSATHPTSFVQYACADALENREQMLNSVNAMLAEYRRRRDWLIPALNEIDGFNCAMPEGAFYAWVDVRQLLGNRFNSSAEVAEFLLTNAHVMVTDGAGFGGDGFLRFSYATSMDNLQHAVAAIKSAFK
jgi:aspartate aminotransferase